MVKEGLACGEELGRMEGVRDRCRRIRRLQRGSGAAVASSGAFGIDVQDLGASPGEGGMPAVHDPVRALEAVEEQSEAHAGLEQGRRVGASGHRGRERRGQLAADARLENEVGDLRRERREHVLPHVVAQEAGGALCALVGPRSADHHQSDRDRPPLGLLEDGLRREAVRLPVEQQPHFLFREAERVRADEGIRMRHAVPGEGHLEQCRPHQHDPQAVRRLLG